MVSLPSFEHFLASLPWSKKAQTMKKCGRFIFYMEIFLAKFALFSWRNRLTKSERANRVISMVYTLIDHTPKAISVREFRQLL